MVGGYLNDEHCMHNCMIINTQYPVNYVVDLNKFNIHCLENAALTWLEFSPSGGQLLIRYQCCSVLQPRIVAQSVSGLTVPTPIVATEMYNLDALQQQTVKCPTANSERSLIGQYQMQSTPTTIRLDRVFFSVRILPQCFSKYS